MNKLIEVVQREIITGGCFLNCKHKKGLYYSDKVVVGSDTLLSFNSFIAHSLKSKHYMVQHIKNGKLSKYEMLNIKSNVEARFTRYNNPIIDGESIREIVKYHGTPEDPNITTRILEHDHKSLILSLIDKIHKKEGE